MFNEDFSLKGGGSPALPGSGRAIGVVPISVTDPAELSKAAAADGAAASADRPKIWSRSMTGCAGAGSCCCSPIRCSNGQASARSAIRCDLRPYSWTRACSRIGDLRLDAPDRARTAQFETRRFRCSDRFARSALRSCADQRRRARRSLPDRVEGGRSIVADADFLDVAPRRGARAQPRRRPRRACAARADDSSSLSHRLIHRRWDAEQAKNERTRRI